MRERENDFFIQKNAILSQKPYKANSYIQVKKKKIYSNIVYKKLRSCITIDQAVVEIIHLESTESFSSSLHLKTLIPSSMRELPVLANVQRFWKDILQLTSSMTKITPFNTYHQHFGWKSSSMSDTCPCQALTHLITFNCFHFHKLLMMSTSRDKCSFLELLISSYYYPICSSIASMLSPSCLPPDSY